MNLYEFETLIENEKGISIIQIIANGFDHLNCNFDLQYLDTSK